jgi:hypothetical protein
VTSFFLINNFLLSMYIAIFHYHLHEIYTVTRNQRLGQTHTYLSIHQLWIRCIWFQYLSTDLIGEALFCTRRRFVQCRLIQCLANSTGRYDDNPGVSSYTFGYRRTAEIFKTPPPPPFIYSIFLKTIPIHIFPLKILT